MRLKFDTNYSKDELQFLEQNNCEILSEIKLSKTNFPESETPRRMFQYGGCYINEIIDDETDKSVWAVLSRGRKGYHWTAYYYSLWSLQQGL